MTENGRGLYLSEAEAERCALCSNLGTWICLTCGEPFCDDHWHDTSKGRNVECRSCEEKRRLQEESDLGYDYVSRDYVSVDLPSEIRDGEWFQWGTFPTMGEAAAALRAAGIHVDDDGKLQVAVLYRLDDEDDEDMTSDRIQEQADVLANVIDLAGREFDILGEYEIEVLEGLLEDLLERGKGDASGDS